jgi:hypothetical protein
MPQALSTRRRWFQFGLGTLLMVVTLVALVLSWELRLVRKRQDALAMISERQGVVERPIGQTVLARRGELCGVARDYESPTLPFWRVWLGDAPVDCFLLPAVTFSKEEMLGIARAFPESDVWRVDDAGNAIDAVNTGESY